MADDKNGRIRWLEKRVNDLLKRISDLEKLGAKLTQMLKAKGG